MLSDHLMAIRVIQYQKT